MLYKRDDNRYWLKFFQKVHNEAKSIATLPDKKSPKFRLSQLLKARRLQQIDERLLDKTQENISFKNHLKNLVVAIFRHHVERPTVQFRAFCHSKKAKVASWKCREAQGEFVPFDQRKKYSEESQ